MLAYTLIILQVAALLLLTPTPPPTLVVMLHDAQGAPVQGAEVQLHDRSGAALLGRAAIDTAGTAAFAFVPADEVRVTILGRLADGTPFRQEGVGAGGIAVILGAPPTRLDLRVEPDGHVRPDPATMIAPDPGAPLEPPATAAPVATVQPLPTALIAPSSPAIPAPEDDGPAPWLLFARAVVAAALAAMLAATAVAYLATRRR